MRVGNFSVVILGGREVESGYVHLNDNQQYTIRLSNHMNNRRCDAELMIDGKSIGTFRIAPGGRIDLERSPADNGRFTFFRADGPSAEAVAAMAVASADRGLVQVRFKGEASVFDAVKGGSVIIPAQHPQRVEPMKAARSRGGATGQSCGGDMGGNVGGGDVVQTNACLGFTAQPETGRWQSQHPNPSRPNMARSAGVTGLSGHSDQSFVEAERIDYDELLTTVINLRLVHDDDGPRPLVASQRGNPVPPPVV